jgi:hypothetical protein
MKILYFPAVLLASFVDPNYGNPGLITDPFPALGSRGLGRRDFGTTNGLPGSPYGGGFSSPFGY